MVKLVFMRKCASDHPERDFETCDRNCGYCEGMAAAIDRIVYEAEKMILSNAGSPEKALETYGYERIRKRLVESEII